MTLMRHESIKTTMKYYVGRKTPRTLPRSCGGPQEEFQGTPTKKVVNLRGIEFWFKDCQSLNPQVNAKQPART